MRTSRGVLTRGTTAMESLLFFVAIVLAAMLLVKDTSAHGLLGVLREIVLFMWKIIVWFWGLVKRISPQ